MKIGDITEEHCLKHGIIEHFCGVVWDDDKLDDIGDFCEDLHCCKCRPNHPDNPYSLRYFTESDYIRVLPLPKF